MADEDPSKEDIERFSTHQAGYSQVCGEEIWDDVTQCPSYGIWLEGDFP